jgi:aspartate/methionine/tyrosine aminotransferase
LNDLFGATPAHPAERLSVIALDHLQLAATRAREILEVNRRALNNFLDSRPELETFKPPFGTTVFPRLRNGDVDEFCKLLREKYETSVVPGKFFEMPNHFRIGIGGDSEMTVAGLERLGQALDEFSKRK